MAGKHLSLMIHFVWSTKRREALLAAEWRTRLYAYIGGVLRKKNAVLLCAGGTDDHLHLYVSLPSTVTVGELVNVMKSNSSRWIHETFPHLKNFAWQVGYGAFSVSKSAEEKLMEYIKNQEAHHSKREFQDEFLSLLKKHQIDYDERYVWD